MCSMNLDSNLSDELDQYAPGVILLPDISSCFSKECVGYYGKIHRTYLQSCLQKRIPWTNCVSHNNQNHNTPKFIFRLVLLF